MAVFFTSDTHFGHGGARGRFRRPFDTTASMDEAIIQRWNETIGPDDEIWHLGDFAVRRPVEEMQAVLHRLAGRKHILLGNNDDERTAGLAGWASVGHYLETEVDGARLVLCHYPFRTWNRMYKGALNLHGHSHGALKPLPRQFDVGVDVWDFRPVRIEQLVASRRARKLQKKSIGAA